MTLKLCKVMYFVSHLHVYAVLHVVLAFAIQWSLIMLSSFEDLLGVIGSYYFNVV